MVKALFDTNIIIDYLNGEEKALKEFHSYETCYISLITYLEVLVGTTQLQEYNLVKEYLLSLNIIEVNLDIANKAVAIRKNYKIKVPDALILATAQTLGAVLVTRNTKDFNSAIPLVRVPYQV